MPSRSTYATIDASRIFAIASLVPRTRTLTEGGVIVTRRPAPRFRARTATAESCRSAGAGTISTDTTAVFALFNRTPSSATPTMTLDLTSAFADPTHSGSVIASVTRRSRLSGPTTSTVAGSAEIFPTMNPGAGSPSTDGTTVTMRVADGSKRIATAEGVTCVTTTANGALTRSGDK